MANKIADRQRVYLACRAIFVGQKAELRKQKKIREEIVRWPEVLRSLTRGLSTENVVEILRDLLSRHIFKSELKAKAEFPSLFYTPPEQEVKREASEVKAAKSTAEVLDEVASVGQNDAECNSPHPKVEFPSTGNVISQQLATLPSLYPTYIPYKTQHIILSEAQRMLEESCFEFTRKHMPALLENTGLDCASSLELTKWTRLLAKMADEIPEVAFDLGETPLREVLFSTDKLRHSAVHRVPMTARGIKDLLESAVTLAFTIGDHKHGGQLEEICYELDNKVKAMELNKNALVYSTTADLQDIQRRREELDNLEKEVLATMVKNDQKNRGFIGALLEDSVSRILEGKTEIETEMDDELKIEEDEEEFSECHTSYHVPTRKKGDAPQKKEPEVEGSKQDDCQHNTLKYSLLGPSLTKAGQDSVDQSKVSEIIYNASKGSKFFNREEVKDKILTQKIEQILEKKRRLEKLDLTRELRAADQLITQLEVSRDLTQYIVHVDCDAFYAAVEQLDRPELKDVPFAVGGGVLTTCNYLARKFGCRSGMAGFVAKKLCPNLLLLPLNFDKYTSKAQEIRQVLAQYDPRFQSASIDEAYLNITEYCVEHNMTPGDVVQQMRDEIHEKTKITVSAGIAANAKLAKICSNMNKPNGQYILPNDRNAIMNFMRDLPTRKVNGIGRVLERELQEIGVKTCGDVYPHRQLLTYEFLVMCYLGLGRTEVQPVEEFERKSVGTESTFRDLSDPVQLREKLRQTADELEKDMRRAECKGRTLVLKVKLHTYEVLTRQAVTPRAICAADDLYNYSLPILAKLEQEVPGMKLRLMGLRCTHLVSTKKPDARTFFGLRPLKTGSDGTADGGTNESAQEDDIPQELLDQLPHDDTHEPGVDLAEHSTIEKDTTYRHHGKEILPNPNPKRPAPDPEPEEYWDCPICCRPQATDERLFNEHIDLCLSRQAIRDTVQREFKPGPSPAADAAPPAKRRKGSGEKKQRSRTTTSVDPKQTKLFFGGGL
ncbi:hypothetical protein F4814DRAFT_442222 [Daldinia grandis]|nr:hypothetical protein F4814DRAFT_442222 [Daldinia grandis]